MISFLQHGFGILLCIGVTFMNVSCQRDSYEVKLSGPTTISDQWIELKPQTPLKAEKDFQNVVLDLETPFKFDFYRKGKGANKGGGILMPDGEVINPEIELVDQHGNIFKLQFAGARKTFSPMYSLRYPEALPRDREYKAVRIRSPRPIKAKKIYWFNESAKDWK
jgi:hypothetical protein